MWRERLPENKRPMLIDWFTVVAQIINFLVLVWLLKRFLYRPVLRAIAAREQRIAHELSAAQQAADNARTELARLEQERAALQVQRDAVLNETRVEALAEQARILAQAHASAQQIEAEWRSSLQTEFEQLRAAVVQRTCGEVLDLTGRLMQDLAQDSLQSRMIMVFLERLHRLDSAARAPFAVLPAQTPWRVSFALPVPQQQQTALAAAISAEFPQAATFEFAVAPGLVCGVELVAGGHRLSWSAQDYLSGLEQSLLNLPQWSAVQGVNSAATS